RDVYPLAFYHPSTGELDLYVGPTANQRFVHADGTRDGAPQTQTTNTNGSYSYDGDHGPASPDDQLAQSSETYDITIDANNMVTLHAYGATQTFSGPVKYIVANTGSGNDTIHILNNSPNDVRVNFVGAGSSSILKNTGPNQYARIGGNDIFEAAGG